MLISHSKKFVFFHLWKTGGSSVYNMLNEHAEIYPNLRNVGYIFKYGLSGLSFFHNDHISASDFMKKTKWVDGYYTFGFVRNPYSWQVSTYNYTRRWPKHHEHDLIKNMSFEQYVDWRVSEGNVWQQKEFYFEGNQQIVEDVFQLENIDEAMEKISKRLVIETPVILKHNISTTSDWRELYSDSTAQKVYETFKEDFLTFGYNEQSYK